LHNAILAVNPGRVREEIYYTGGKATKIKVNTISNPNPNYKKKFTSPMAGFEPTTKRLPHFCPLGHEASRFGMI